MPKPDALKPDRKSHRLVIDESIPFREERTRFLENMLKLGWQEHTVRRYELRLADFAVRVDIGKTGGVSQAEIESVVDDWLKTSKQQYRSNFSHKGMRRRFIIAAKRWLQFLGCFRNSEPAPYSRVISDFENFLKNERGLAPRSIQTRSRFASQFLVWICQQERRLADVSIKDVELYLATGHPRSWSRVSLSICVSSLRAFFRYAKMVKLCSNNVADAIDAPTLYSQATLPKGPSWVQVRRLIASIGTTRPKDIRDRAIITLLAIYGFRVGEVCVLRLENLDWEREQIVVYRGKQGCEQLYPLVREAGEAILLYLQKARPRISRHELFLSRVVPFGPLTPEGMSTIVQRRLKALGVKLPHYGAHSLRHACATHLLAEGFSLKEIGDHLGHRDPRSTQIYAKVDLNGLREVALLDLGGLV